MTTYGQFCPVSIASEVLTERWTPLVVRELLCGSTRFNEIRRGVPLMSPSLLSKRLKMLERVGVVERHEQGTSVSYHLTEAGEELRPVIEGLGEWGQRWGRGDVRQEHLDASLLMWDIHRNVRTECLPPERRVVHFHLRGSVDKKSRFWLVLERDTADLCLIDPGFEIDVHVEAHVEAMVQYWMGDADIWNLVEEGAVVVEGPRSLVRQFPSWFKRSGFADVTRPRSPAPVGSAA